LHSKMLILISITSEWDSDVGLRAFKHKDEPFAL
jgi:hypothetical protein